MFAYFSQQDMANAFAQKHLRSIILNVSFQNTLYFVTLVVLLLLIAITTLIILISSSLFKLSGEGTQRELTNRY